MRRINGKLREARLSYNKKFEDEGKMLASFYDKYARNALRGNDLYEAEVSIAEMLKDLVRQSNSDDTYNLVCDWVEETDMSNSYESYSETKEIHAVPVIDDTVCFLDWMVRKGFDIEEIENLFGDYLVEFVYDFITDEVDTYYDEANDDFYDTFDARHYNGHTLSVESEEDEEDY